MHGNTFRPPKAGSTTKKNNLTQTIFWCGINLALREKSDAPRQGEEVDLVSHEKLEPSRQSRQGGGGGVHLALLFIYGLKFFFPLCPFVIVILVITKFFYYFSHVFLAKNASENHFHFEGPKLS